MHSHSSFLEMKVIIQLSVLTVRLEDTDGGQKPVQLLKWPWGMLSGWFGKSGEYKQKRVRGAADSDYRIYAGSTCRATRSRHGHSSM